MEQVFGPYPSENTVLPARPGRHTLEPKRDRTHQPQAAFDLVPGFQQPLPGGTLPQAQQLQATRLLPSPYAILSQRRLQFPPRGLRNPMQQHTVVHTLRNHTRHRRRYFGQKGSGNCGLTSWIRPWIRPLIRPWIRPWICKKPEVSLGAIYT